MDRQENLGETRVGNIRDRTLGRKHRRRGLGNTVGDIRPLMVLQEIRVTIAFRFQEGPDRIITSEVTLIDGTWLSVTVRGGASPRTPYSAVMTYASQIVTYHVANTPILR